VTPAVRVYCQDEGHRRQGERGPLRRSEVCEFRRDESGRWLDLPGEAALTAHLKAEPRAAGPRVLGERIKHVGQFDAPPEEQRYELACELCPRRVVVRDENLQPALDAVWRADESAVPLHVLAAILRKQQG
jgi:hypothetical protein